MNDRKYLYKKVFDEGDTIIIQYTFNRYYVSRVYERGNTSLLYPIKSYKTLSGAEKFLKERAERIKPDTGKEPELFYGTEKFIKEGKYWRA